MLPLVSAVAVDPWGLVPHGPLRWLLVTSLLLAALTTARGLVLPPRAVIGWGVLLAALAAGAAAGADPVHAVIGTPDRRMGLLAWIGMAGAHALGHTIRSPEHRRILLRGAILAGLAVGVSAGLDLLGMLPEDGVPGRLGGSFGQPAHLAAMSVLLAPLGVAAAADRGLGRAWRPAGGLAAVAAVAALLGSQTRGAWLGLAAGGILLLPRAWRWARAHPSAAHPSAARQSAARQSAARPSAARPSAARPLVALLVGTVLLGALALTPLGPRAAAGLDLTEGTAAGRLAEWRVAARVIAAHPALGVGPEGYRIAFPAHVDADYGRTFGRDVVTDRAHSGLLDVTAAGGLAAGAGYLLLLVLVIIAAVRATRVEDPALLGMAVAVVAYAAQQQVLFPLAEVDPVWWLLAGAVSAAVTGPTSASPGLDRAVRSGAVLLLGAALVAGSLGVVADRRMATAAALATRGATGQAAVLADAATRLRPDDVRLWFAAARIAVAGGRITDVDAALARIDRGLTISPADPALTAERVDLLVERGRRSGLPGDLALGVQAGRALVAADPTNAGHHVGLAVALAYDGRLAEARRALERATALDEGAAGLPAARALLARYGTDG